MVTPSDILAFGAVFAFFGIVLIWRAADYYLEERRRRIERDRRGPHNQPRRDDDSQDGAS